MISRTIHFHVPPARDLGYSVNAAQLVTAHFGDQTFVFQAQLDVTPEKMTMIGIDSLGRRALTIVSTDGRIDVDAAPWLPSDIRPANILADIAMVYWPQSYVQAGLEPSRVVVRTTDRARTVTLDGTDIVRIDYDGDPRTSWPASAHYHNLAFKYDLDIQSAVAKE